MLFAACFLQAHPKALPTSFGNQKEPPSQLLFGFGMFFIFRCYNLDYFLAAKSKGTPILNGKNMDMKTLLAACLLPLLGLWVFVPDRDALAQRTPAPFVVDAGMYSCEDGTVSFKSEAPLEVIQAASNQLRGVFDPEKQAFAWSVEVNSFDGFNNPLQREHFNENYLESRRFPKASFAGKVIENVDFTKNGSYSVRAKGKLIIHGKEQERIIKSQLTVAGNRIEIQTTFRVLLADHDIRIPKIVYQKIAEEVVVSVRAELQQQ
jgi:hypothetical protein